MSFDLLKVLPSVEELGGDARVPDGLQYSFNDALDLEVAKSMGTPETEDKSAATFDLKSTKDWDAFFTSIGGAQPKVTVAVKKRRNLNVTRRSLEGNTSKKGSFAVPSEEFPVSLLKDNAERINKLHKSLQEQINSIKNIESEKQSFQRMIDELGEAVNRWREKTAILSEKSQVNPEYQEADEFLSRATKQHLEAAELVLRKMKATKRMEIILAENLPDPDGTAEAMGNIKTLVAEFISYDR